MIVGATFKVDEIAYWKARLPVNMMMRIFPNSDGLPPDWTDDRFVYCQQNGVIPFVSSKVDGDATKLATLKTWLQAMPSWVTMLYLTDRHEPEGDIAAAAYQANFNAALAMVNTLSSTLRAKIRIGPVLTRQATENKPIATPTAYDGSNATGGVYSTYDPGTGDFFGVDYYHNSWGSPSTTAVTTPIDPVTMLAKFKAYKKSSTDHRPRMMPELGLIGFPVDTDGSKRAAWYQGMYDELRKWTVATVGFDFLGFVIWNTEGKSGTSITGLGKKRWFQFDRRHNGGPYPATGTVTDPEGGYDLLTGSKVTTTFNALASANAGVVVTPPTDTTGGDTTGSGTGGTGTGGGDTPTEPPPDPGDPGPGTGTPVDDPGTPTTPTRGGRTDGTPWSPRAYVAGPEFTMLVTSPTTLRAVLSPVYDWSSFGCTLKFNAAGSGTFTAPARPELLDAVSVPNRRITIVRNAQPALGIPGEILMSGPIEQHPYKWADDSDTDGGLGSVTVAFTSNEAYVAERITFPNPAAAAEAQGTDYFTRSAINAETTMRELVNLNAGPGALVARRVPLLALGAVAGVGTAVDVTTRFDQLTDVLRYLAVLGGNLGWRVRDTGTALLFEVYAPRNRPGAYFGRSRGNVRTLTVAPAAPVATVAIAGGVGSGAGRLVVERASADFTSGGWRRMETFVNQNGVSTTLGLQQYADADLDGKKATTTVSVEPIDPFGGGYGLKYRLGDAVPCELPTHGTTVVDVVTAVDVKANAGEPATFTPTIGPRPKLTDDQFIRDMQARLSRVERS